MSGKDLLIDHVALACDWSKVNARKAVNALVSGLSKLVLKDGGLTINGIGRFEVRKSGRRTFFNPKTQKTERVTPKTKLKFHASKVIDRELNKE